MFIDRRLSLLEGSLLTTAIFWVSYWANVPAGVGDCDRDELLFDLLLFKGVPNSIKLVWLMKSRSIDDEQLSANIAVKFNADLNMKILLSVDESFAWNDMKDLRIGDFNLQ